MPLGKTVHLRMAQSCTCYRLAYLSLALGNISMQCPGTEWFQGGGHLVGITFGVCEDDGPSHGSVRAHTVFSHTGPLRPMTRQDQVTHTRRCLRHSYSVKTSVPHGMLSAAIVGQDLACMGVEVASEKASSFASQNSGIGPYIAFAPRCRTVISLRKVEYTSGEDTFKKRQCKLLHTTAIIIAGTAAATATANLKVCQFTFCFSLPTRSTSLKSGFKKRFWMSFTQLGSVALKRRVWIFSAPPDLRINSTSSTNPMLSISSHSSRTRNLQKGTVNERQ